MAVTTLYFGATSEGAGNGTTWEDRAAFVVGGAINTLISAFDFTTNTLVARIGPGTHTLTTAIQTFTGTATPSLAIPCILEGCLSGGTRWQPPDPDWCSAQPAWDADDATYPMPVIATTTNIATVSNSNVHLYGLKFTASGRNAGMLSQFYSGAWLQVINNTSNTAAVGIGASPASLQNCYCECSGTSYDSAINGGPTFIDNIRCEGNPSASSGTRNGYTTTTITQMSRITSVGNPGHGIEHTSTTTSARLLLKNCVVADNAGDGIKQSGTSTTTLSYIMSSMITGAHANGINVAGTGNAVVENCRIRDYVTSAVASNVEWADPPLRGNITTAGTDADEYVDAVNGDYRIKNTSTYWGKGLGAGDEAPAAVASGGGRSSIQALSIPGVAIF